MWLRPMAMFLLLVVLLCSWGCKSFKLETGSADLTKISSAWIVVGAKDDLLAEDPKDLVRPENKGKYAYFVQLQPLADGTSWKTVDTAGWPLEPDIDDQTIGIKIGKSWVRQLPDGEIALIVLFSSGRSWQCDRAALVLKGDVSYTIGPDNIVRNP